MAYKLVHYHLSLSSWAGIAIGASHWYCRVYWEDCGKHVQVDAERVDPENPYKDIRVLSGRFDTRAAAQAAGLRVVRRVGKNHRWRVVTLGDGCSVDPVKCLSAPGNLKTRLNKLWRQFEELDGWEAPKERWPEVQKICDRWSLLCGDK